MSRRDERWENMMTQAAALTKAAADAAATGDRKKAEHWKHMANMSIDRAAQIREGQV